MRAALAVDLGGTLLRAGIVGSDAGLLHARTMPLAGRRGNAEIAALVTQAIAESSAWARSARIDLVGAGLAVPGIVDHVHGVMRFSANLGVEALPVGQIVSDLLGLPAVVDNDVRAAAWGEWHWGSGAGTTHMLYVNVGTGIAAAVIAGGVLFRGARGGAGELGHVAVVSDGAPCRCGRRGCLETVASGWGIVARAQAAAPERFPAQLRHEVEVVFEAAAGGDPVAARVLDEAKRHLGRAVAAVVRLFDPERVILGGGLCYPESPLVEGISAAVAGAALDVETPAQVAFARFARDAGLIGAAALLLAGRVDDRTPGSE